MEATNETSLKKRRLFFALQCMLLLVAGMGTFMSMRPENIVHGLIYIAGAIIFAVTLYLWFRMHPRSEWLHAAGNRLFIAGVVITTVPLLYYGFAGTYGLLKVSQLALFQNMVRIAAYEEQPIVWEGFEYPVGVRVSIKLDYPFNPGGWIRYPRIAIPGESVLSKGQESEAVENTLPDPARYWEKCQTPLVEGEGCFTQPIWPIGKYPELTSESMGELVFDLYPSNLNYLESPNRLCIRERSPYAGIKVAAAPVVYWHLVYNNELFDIAPILQAAIVEKSSFFTSAEAIEGAYAGIQSSDLAVAGFQSCQIVKAIRHSEESECFCKDEPQSAKPGPGEAGDKPDS